MEKCSEKEGGYAASLCQHMAAIADVFPTKKSKGIYKHTIVNFIEGTSKGTLVKIKQGEHLAEGLVFNYCPFCGGKLRDTTKDGE